MRCAAARREEKKTGERKQGKRPRLREDEARKREGRKTERANDAKKSTGGAGGSDHLRSHVCFRQQRVQ